MTLVTIEILDRPENTKRGFVTVRRNGQFVVSATVDTTEVTPRLVTIIMEAIRNDTTTKD